VALPSLALVRLLADLGPSVVTGLADFLLARIAEDEMQAQAVGNDAWLYDGFGCRAMARPDTKLEYADRWMPSRVLAECEAKRQIVERAAGLSEMIEPPTTLTLRDDVLKLLALPYADHPDYRKEWRP